jgi:ketosteroid isomerase-like protein
MVRFIPIPAFDRRRNRHQGDQGVGNAETLPIPIPVLRDRLMRALLLLALSPSLLASHAFAAAHPHKEHKRDYRREIEAVEEQWRTAQIAGDVATMDKLLADDYFGISMAGQLNNKTQQLERLQKRTLVLTKIDVSDVKIKLVGRVAIVTSLARIEGVNEGESMTGTYRYTRVYKRYPDGSWKITNFEVTKVPGIV